MYVERERDLSCYDRGPAEVQREPVDLILEKLIVAIIEALMESWYSAEDLIYVAKFINRYKAQIQRVYDPTSTQLISI